MVENIIAYHCGPAVAGIKPANTVSFCKKKYPEVRKDIKRLNTEMNAQGIFFEIIRETERCILVMAYRARVLENHLKSKETAEFMENFGYSGDFSLRQYISRLKSRLCVDEFPHEIGVFLGYPIHDICGFMCNQGKKCLFTGEWKVYAEEDKAKKLFCLYKTCRKGIMRCIMSGMTLAQMFCAA